MRGQKTGGRQKGSRNKRTKARDAALKDAAQQITAAIPNAFQGDAHMLLIAVYKNRKLKLPIRIDAAKGAIPYEKARLAQVETQRADDDHVPLPERLQAYTRERAIVASEGKVVEMGKKGGRAR